MIKAIIKNFTHNYFYRRITYLNYFFYEFAILELKFYFKILHKSKYIQDYDKVTQKFRKRIVLILEKKNQKHVKQFLE
jgi:hypothetical protein